MSGLTRCLRWSRVGGAVGLAALVLQPVRADAGSPVVLKAELEGGINTVTVGYIEHVVKRAESERKEVIVLYTHGRGVGGPFAIDVNPAGRRAKVDPAD